MKPPSPEFQDVARRAVRMALEAPSDAVRYMAGKIPVWAQYEPDPAQRRAGGCQNCLYLGLWAHDWPGQPPSIHGIIWLFETGIRGMGGDLQDQTYRTLLHEFDHALQKDHVLDELERGQRGGKIAAPGKRGGCGCR